MSKLQLRCSALPLVWRCPGAALQDGLRVVEDSDAGATGSACHLLCRSLPKTGAIDWEKLDSACEEYTVADREEVRELCQKAERMWLQLQFNHAATEFPLTHCDDRYKLTGHADGLCSSVDYDVVDGYDWKFGRKDRDHSQQMRGYCALALKAFYNAESATMTILWVRDEETEIYRMDQDGADEWFKELESRVVHWDGAFHPGAHCQYCPRRHDCSASNAIERSAVAAIRDLAQQEVDHAIASLPPAAVLQLYHQAKLVGEIADKILKSIKVRAGQDDLQDGATRLVVSETAVRKLDPVLSWPVLEEFGFKDEHFAQCTTISVSKAEEVAAKLAGKGAGAAAKRELDKRLKAAGAVEYSVNRRMEEKRI